MSTIRKIIILGCASTILSCNALGEFPAVAEFETDLDSMPDTGFDMPTASDMKRPDMDALDMDELTDGIENDADQDFVPTPISVERCPTAPRAVAVRPRIRTAGAIAAGAAVWISPQDNRAMIDTIGGFNNTEYDYTDTGGNPPNLDNAVSTDLGIDREDGTSYFFSVTRVNTDEEGIALYPQIFCRQGCDWNLLWATAVAGAPGTVNDILGQEQKRFWLGKEGDLVRMYLMGEGGTLDDLSSADFCRPDEPGCTQPGPLEADAFGTSFDTIFMRDRNGFARAWQPGTPPAPIIIDGAPVRFDDFSAVAEVRGDQESYLFSHVDREDETVSVYRAKRPNLQNRMQFELTPLINGNITVRDIWRARVVGSGDGVWHVVTTTSDTTPEDDMTSAAEVRVYLRESGRFGGPTERTLDLPEGELQNWDAFASDSGPPETNASIYISYIAGDRCNVSVENHVFGAQRQ